MPTITTTEITLATSTLIVSIGFTEIPYCETTLDQARPRNLRSSTLMRMRSPVEMCSGT